MGLWRVKKWWKLCAYVSKCKVLCIQIKGTAFASLLKLTYTGFVCAEFGLWSWTLTREFCFPKYKIKSFGQLVKDTGGRSLRDEWFVVTCTCAWWKSSCFFFFFCNLKIFLLSLGTSSWSHFISYENRFREPSCVIIEVLL